MKKLLSMTVASLALAVVADSTYSPITVKVDTFVPASANVIIPVPFSTIGSTEGSVSVHDLVKAANLPDDTMLYYFNGASTNYLAWIKLGSAWTISGISATSINNVPMSPGSETVNVSVGSALWLVFPAGTDLSKQKVVFYGGTPATTTSTVNLSQINLLSNPTKSTVTGATLESKLEFAQKGDRIRLITADFSGEYVKYVNDDESYWMQNTGTGYVKVQLPSIASYQGFWYIPNSRSGTQEINW